MKNKEKGVLTIEAAISLLSITMFVLFLFNFVRVYRAQSAVGHAAIQTADAIALESYLRENCYNGDADDIAYIANHMTGSSNITADTFVSLRNTDMVALSKEKFILALGQNKTAADNVLKNYGIENGVDGIDFSDCSVDLKNDDVIVKVKYTVKMQFAFFGIKEITLTKSAKAKTFGEILFELTVKSANERGGSASGGGSYQQGETVKIEAEANFGYKFKRWNDGSTEPHREITIDGDAEYIAEFEREIYGVAVNVAVVADGKTTVCDSNATDITGAKYVNVSGAGEYEYESYVKVNATEGAHYKITKIKDNTHNKTYTNATGFEIKSISSVYSITVYVEPKEYSVSVAVANGKTDLGTVSVNGTNKSGGYVGNNTSENASSVSITVPFGKKVYYTAEPNYCADFSNWEDGNKNENRDSAGEVVTGNVTHTATFTKKTFNVTTSVSGEGNVSGAGTYEYGAKVTVKATPKDGYQFEYMTVNGTENNNSEFSFDIKSNVSIAVVFKYIPPSISLSAGSTEVNSTKLVASVTPKNCSVTWSSSDSKIVSVDNEGKITANGVGTAEITATAAINGQTAKASITVHTDKTMEMMMYCRRDEQKYRHYYKDPPNPNEDDKKWNSGAASGIVGVNLIRERYTYSEVSKAVTIGAGGWLSKSSIKYAVAKDGIYAGIYNPQQGWNSSNVTGYVLLYGNYEFLFFIENAHAANPNGGYYDYYITGYN